MQCPCCGVNVREGLEESKREKKKQGWEAWKGRHVRAMADADEGIDKRVSE